MGFYMEIFEARVLGENLSFWLKNRQFSRKQDTILQNGDFSTKN
jgi:hypothetical protein